MFFNESTLGQKILNYSASQVVDCLPGII